MRAAWRGRLVGLAARSSHDGWLGSSDAPCDPAHNTPSLDNRICPERHSFRLSLNTTNYASGQHTFIARAEDLAGNVGTMTWTLIIDRSEPTPPTQTQVDFPTPVSVAAALQWAHDHGVTPQQLVGQIAAGTDTLTLFYEVAPDATDEEIINDTPEGLFADLAENGQDLSAYYTPSPLISAMVVNGTPTGTFSALTAMLDVRVASPMSRRPFRTLAIGNPAPPSCSKPWWPDQGAITTRRSTKDIVRPRIPSAEKRYVHQLFSWSSDNLARMKCDSDVTYEPDAVYTKLLGTYLALPREVLRLLSARRDRVSA